VRLEGKASTAGPRHAPTTTHEPTNLQYGDLHEADAVVRVQLHLDCGGREGPQRGGGELRQAGLNGGPLQAFDALPPVPERRPRRACEEGPEAGSVGGGRGGQQGGAHLKAGPQSRGPACRSRGTWAPAGSSATACSPGPGLAEGRGAR
jgi:hypothetical protein